MADAILKAAVKPTRDIRVGSMSKINTFVAKNLPGIADRMTAKQIPELQRDEPPKHPDGTLYTPGESGRTHGDHVGADCNLHFAIFSCYFSILPPEGGNGH